MSKSEQDHPINIVDERLDKAHGVLNPIEKTFDASGQCSMPDDRLQDALGALHVLMRQAREALDAHREEQSYRELLRPMKQKARWMSGPSCFKGRVAARPF